METRDRQRSGKGGGSARDLGLLLDDALVNDLLLVERPRKGIPVEAAAKKPAPAAVTLPAFLVEPPIKLNRETAASRLSRAHPASARLSALVSESRDAAGQTRQARVADLVGSPGATRRNISALAAGIASLAIPGWGQALNGQHRKAILFHAGAMLTIATGILLAVRTSAVPVLCRLLPLDPGRTVQGLTFVLIGGTASWLLSAYDAVVVRIARR